MTFTWRRRRHSFNGYFQISQVSQHQNFPFWIL